MGISAECRRQRRRLCWGTIKEAFYVTEQTGLRRKLACLALLFAEHRIAAAISRAAAANALNR
jgi:hypothetical protein